MATIITKNIAHCQELLREGALVAIPTETVYGLAANIYNPEAVRNIFEKKGRPLFNPLIVHIHSLEQLAEITAGLPPLANTLARAFWPGPLTLILPKGPSVPELITAGKSTVGVRMPQHPMALELLRGLPFPLAAPSANPFTRISPTSAGHVYDYFGDTLPAILDGGPCTIGLESTILGFEGDAPVLYRQGGIPLEKIVARIGPVKVQTTNEGAPQAPGMLLKHYAPRTPLLMTSDIEASIAQHAGLRLAVLTFSSGTEQSVAHSKRLSPTGNLNEAAQGLFTALHELDRLKVDLILAERFPDEGLGRSINDRLTRAQKS